MQFDEQKSLKEIFESMDDFDLCEVVNKSASEYTNEALEIAYAEYAKRKAKKPKIEATALKNRKKQIYEIQKMRRQESVDFFNRHVRWRLICGLGFLLFIIIIVATR